VYNHNFLGAWSLVCIVDSKLNVVAAPQPIRVHAVPKVVHMHEDVWLAIVASDETVSLLVIEPLDVPGNSIRHFANSPYLMCAALLA
jgi:hypothetical protein